MLAKACDEVILQNQNSQGDGYNLQSFTKYLRLTLVFMWNSALREKFKFCFSRAFW